MILPVAHTHFRFKKEVFTGDLPWQIDAEEHRLVNPDEPVIWLQVPKLIVELSEMFAVQDAEAKYRFDTHAATEYLILEVYPKDAYPNERYRYDIFSCYCENWESEGLPPF